MNYFLLAVVLFTIAALFVQSYIKLSADAEAGPASLTIGEWLKHTWLEIGLNVLSFVAFALNVDIGLAEKATEVATQGNVDAATSLTFAGAVAAGMAIYKTVQLTLLPLFNAILGARTARRVLRDKL